jgi:Tripartite tricarboxylate transporter family receptor/Amidohydrolase family
MHDLLFRRARLVDGSGAPARLVDVAVDAGLIATISDAPQTSPRPAARQVVDCEGLVVAPGFIDAHTHDDALMLEKAPLQQAHPKLAQGVATVVVGNCGIIKAGRVRALGVSGAQRSAVLPDVPTIQEAGLKNYETTAWGGVVGPPGMPADLVQPLNRDINRTLALPAVKERYAAPAWEIQMSTAPEALMAMARAETPRWAEVVKRSGAKME